MPNKSQWTMTHIGIIGASLVLLAAILSAIYMKEGRERMPHSDAGDEADALPTEVMQTSFKMVDGESKKLADYGGKVLVVDLWATWCNPCRQEIPHLIEMANLYRDKGVEVIGLTTEDPESDVQLVKDFSQQYKINYPVGWAEPISEQLMNGRDGIPQTIIIGRDGKVKRHFVGFNREISVPQLKEALDEAVAEGSF
ncbi:MAG: TlpA family protein disulfide reductase [Blastocatellia bacterium]|nr:TlpA family protein disulfide reductase [Blastocatellia bacterium]